MLASAGFSKRTLPNLVPITVRRLFQAIASMYLPCFQADIGMY